MDKLKILVVDDESRMRKLVRDFLERERYLADMEFSDAYTLAHRVSTSAERLYRFSSIETTQYIKALLRKLATRMDVLTHCSKRVYDTSRSQSWDDACEHYIFGMRRILI